MPARFTGLGWQAGRDLRHHRAMKVLKLLPLMLLGACSSGPSNTEALKSFAAVSNAMATTQSAAVSAARTPAVAPPATLTLNYSGPCLVGGTAAVTGSYDGDGTGQQAAFNLTTTFTGCQTALGTIDGSLSWTSTVNGTTYTAAMTGSLDYQDPNTAFSCDYDLQSSVAVSGASTDISYSGSLCGFDVNTDLHVNTSGT